MMNHLHNAIRLTWTPQRPIATKIIQTVCIDLIFVMLVLPNNSEGQKDKMFGQWQIWRNVLKLGREVERSREITPELKVRWEKDIMAQKGSWLECTTRRGELMEGREDIQCIKVLLMLMLARARRLLIVQTLIRWPWIFFIWCTKLVNPRYNGPWEREGMEWCPLLLIVCYKRVVLEGLRRSLRPALMAEMGKSCPQIKLSLEILYSNGPCGPLSPQRLSITHSH